MASKPCELRLGGSGKVALVDAEDFLKLNRYNWLLRVNSHYPFVFRFATIAGKKRKISLNHQITQVSVRVRIVHANGDAFDFRRSNLWYGGGNVARTRSKRAPWSVQISIDGTCFHVGSWPTKEWAEKARQAAAEASYKLRGHGLARSTIQRALDKAAGRWATIKEYGRRQVA